jgi:hypothetical protein
MQLLQNFSINYLQFNKIRVCIIDIIFILQFLRLRDRETELKKTQLFFIPLYADSSKI